MSGGKFRVCTGVITMVLVKCCNLKSLFKKLFVQCFVQKVLGCGGGGVKWG